ncbi:MAG: selenium cofactor biosynthesis protein YqeC [Bacillota bacterium]|nr:selenium cofactor biosynthesis protein YqeC [Bacillota bacterium]
MEFWQLLGLNLFSRQIISFVGAGGKTTALFSLAAELRKQGKAVLVTTTTAIFVPDREPTDFLVVNPELSHQNQKLFMNTPAVTVWGSVKTDEGKLRGVSLKALSDVVRRGWFDVILIEADGSRQKPVKAPAGYEPAIPDNTHIVVGVIGLSAVGKPADPEYIHRLPHFCGITGAEPGEQIEPDHLAALIMHPQGLFKGTPVMTERILLLNQADNLSSRHAAESIVLKVMAGTSKIDRVLITQFDPLIYSIKWGERK